MLLRKKRFAVWGTAICVLAVLVSGCLKSIDTASNNNNKRAFVSLLQLAPASPTMDIYVNDLKSTQPILPGAVSSAYSPITPGTLTIAFKKANTDSVVTVVPAAAYDSMKYYTLLVYNDQPNSVKAARIYDDFSVMTTNDSYWRFFHVGRGVAAVDLFIDNAKIDASRTYTDNVTGTFFNEFSTTIPGNHLVQIKKAGSDSLISQTNTTFYQRTAYTIILRGTAGSASAGTASTLEVIALPATN